MALLSFGIRTPSLPAQGDNADLFRNSTEPGHPRRSFLDGFRRKAGRRSDYCCTYALNGSGWIAAAQSTVLNKVCTRADGHVATKKPYHAIRLPSAASSRSADLRVELR